MTFPLPRDLVPEAPLVSAMTANELAARILDNKDWHDDLMEAVTYRYGKPLSPGRLSISDIIEDEVWRMVNERDMAQPSDDVIEAAWHLVAEGAHRLDDAREAAADAEYHAKHYGVERIMWG